MRLFGLGPAEFIIIGSIFLVIIIALLVVLVVTLVKKNQSPAPPQPQQSVCPNCGAPVADPTTQFCTSCGTTLK